MTLHPGVLINVLALYVIIMVIRNMRGGDDDETRRLFLAMLIITAVILVTDAVCWQFDGVGFPGGRALLTALNSLIFLLQAWYCRLWLKYEALWIHGRIAMRPGLWAVLINIPFCVMVVLILSNLWTKSVFYIDEAFTYRTGGGYYLTLAVIAAYVLWALAMAARGAVRAENDRQRRNCLSMLQFLFLQMLGPISDICALSVSVTAPLNAAGLLMVYLNVQQQAATQQQLTIARQKQELTEKRIAIMLSQIQPHFLYNALGAIKHLCELDPATARTAVDEFSDFLRGNLDSLTSDKPISFEQELKHTDNYLHIEKLRFQDSLNIEYDIETTLFRLPTLTLQPIVENAVRYGVTKRDEGGTVRIETRETDAAYIITVSDDGVGFDPMAVHEDGRTRIGIQNVRSRLAGMVNGTLEIRSTPGVGTTATITIPKEDN